MIPRFEGRLARLDATAVLAEYLGPRFEGVGKRLVVTVAGQGADIYLYTAPRLQARQPGTGATTTSLHGLSLSWWVQTEADDDDKPTWLVC